MLTDGQIREALRPLCRNETTLAMLVEDGMDEYRAIEAAVLAEAAKDSEELQFLNDDLLYWVDRAVDKGNANSDIEEAYQRYEKWIKDRAAIDAARGKP